MKLIISAVVIVLILSAICMCVHCLYATIELSRFKSEIAYIMASFQTMNASLDVIHQLINDLAGTLNTSVEQIQVRENEKQQITNASLDVLHQKTNDLFSFHPGTHENICNHVAYHVLLQATRENGNQTVSTTTVMSVIMNILCKTMVSAWINIIWHEL